MSAGAVEARVGRSVERKDYLSILMAVVILVDFQILIASLLPTTSYMLSLPMLLTLFHQLLHHSLAILILLIQ